MATEEKVLGTSFELLRPLNASKITHLNESKITQRGFCVKRRHTSKTRIYEFGSS